MASYKERYNQFQADVDARMGRTLGFGGKLKRSLDPSLPRAKRRLITLLLSTSTNRRTLLGPPEKRGNCRRSTTGDPVGLSGTSHRSIAGQGMLAE